MQVLLHTLGIDWKLLIAQIINFFLLFFIIYKFLAKPLNNILEERKRKIEEGYKNREEAERLIEEVKKLRAEILEKAEKEKEEILTSAYQQKEILVKQFLEEIDKVRKEFLVKFEQEKEEIRNRFYLELKEELPEILEKLAYKVFHDKKLNREFIQKILNE